MGSAELLSVVTKMIKKKLIIINKLGLHARAAAKLVDLANRFHAESQIIKDDAVVNAKSIMGLMMLGASKGTEFELAVEGSDEQEAFHAIEALINDGFGEE